MPTFFKNRHFGMQSLEHEHREISLAISTPSAGPSSAPSAGPSSAPASNPGTPTLNAKKGQQERVLKAQAAGKKATEMKDGVNAAINALKGLRTAPGAPAAAPGTPALNPLDQAKASVEGMKKTANINTVPARGIVDMLADARAIGSPDIDDVCIKIEEAMTTADAEIAAEPDPTKQKEISDLKTVLEANSKLMLADLLTADVKKVKSVFTIDPADSQQIKDKAENSNEFKNLKTSMPEAQKRKAMGVVMANHGVLVEEVGGKFVVTPPSGNIERFMNMLGGFLMQFGMGKKEVKTTSSAAPSASASAPKTGPTTTLPEPDAKKVEADVKANGVNNEKTKATDAKNDAEKLLNGFVAVPGAPARPVLAASLNGTLQVLKNEKIQIETDIKNLKAAPTPDAAKIATEEGKLTLKTAEITAKEGEIKIQEGIVKKETEKIKYMDDLVEAENGKIKELKELKNDMIAFDANPEYQNTDTTQIADAMRNLLIPPNSTQKLNLPLLVDQPKWQALQTIVVQKFGMEKTDLNLVTKEGDIVMENPEKFVAALKVLKGKLTERVSSIDKRTAEFIAAGAPPVGAKSVVKFEMETPGIKFEYKNLDWAVSGDPGEVAYNAMRKLAAGSSLKATIGEYIDKKIQNDLLSPAGQAFLLHACLDNTPALDAHDAKQITELAEAIPDFKNRLNYTDPIPKEPSVIESIKKHSLVTQYKLTANLKAYWGI